MIRFILVLILFLFFIFQGTVMQVFTPEWFGYHFKAVPHFLLIGLLLTSLYFNHTVAVIYSILYGFLIDIIYTNLIGPYAFCMALTVYLTAAMAKFLHMNIFVVFLIAIAAVTMLEMGIYEIYALIGKAGVPFSEFMGERMASTLVLNGAFFIVVFHPLKHLFSYFQKRELDD